MSPDAVNRHKQRRLRSRMSSDEIFWAEVKEDGGLEPRPGEDERHKRWVAAKERRRLGLQKAFEARRTSTTDAAAHALNQAVEQLLKYDSELMSYFEPEYGVGRAKARRELSAIVDAAKKLDQLVLDLSSTAESAVNRASGKGISYLERTRGMLSDLSIVAQNAADGDIPNARPEGRQTNEQVRKVAARVVATFEEITGLNTRLPAQGRRGLLPLMREVFKLLGIKSNPKSMIDWATNQDPVTKPRQGT